MRGRPALSLVVPGVLLSVLICPAEGQQHEYLGLNPPGTTPELFAPGLVSTGHHEHSSPTFSPDGGEIFWSVVRVPFEDGGPHLIMRMARENGAWQEPSVAPFSGSYSEDGPRFSPDGRQLFFYSKRPDSPGGEPKDYADIWFLEKGESGWGVPQRLEGPVNTDSLESSPSMTEGGGLYFMRGVNEPEVQYEILRSGWTDGEYSNPDLLGSEINSPYHDYTPFIASDESFLLFSSVGRPDSFGAGDLYVSFREDGGKWSEAMNLGAGVNTPANERFPSVSPDGKYLFFVSNTSLEENRGRLDEPQNGYCDVYWVDMEVVHRLGSDRGRSFH